MAEYLSPGVYVEEFDSGGVPMDGASTSTAGFIGLAQRGAIEGLPQLITGVADFRRIFGSYLSQNAFYGYRYLAYAVDQFFLNGGSRCYVMRVAPDDAKPATNVTDANKDTLVLGVTAKNPGEWGNQIRVVVTPDSKAKTFIKAIDGGDGSKRYAVKSSAGFNVGDIVAFSPDGTTKQYNKVVSSQDNVIELETALTGDVVETNPVPKKFLTTCEFTLQVIYGDEVETYEQCSLNPTAYNHVDKLTQKSSIVSLTDLTVNRVPVAPAAPAAQVVAPAVSTDPAAPTDPSAPVDPAAPAEPSAPVAPAANTQTNTTVPPYQTISGQPEGDKVSFAIGLAGGSDGTITPQLPADIFIGTDNGPGKRSGIQSFIDNDEVSIMAIPGVTDQNVQLNLVAHCENLRSRFAVLDFPNDVTKVQDVQQFRDIYDSQYAAIYNPWLQVFDPLEKRSIYMPPSASMAGIYARSDNSRGVHKAPANEVVRGVTGLSVQYNKGEQDILNPKGVNLIRAFTGQGIRVWGARTLSSNGLWKYINVRRLYIFLEETIKNGTNWVVFEPNDEQLWARVHRTIEAFLTTVWRSGALMGATPAEAFYINVGRSTMTQDDIDNGRLICVIGVAAVKPAEFVIFRLTQKTADNQ